MPEIQPFLFPESDLKQTPVLNVPRPTMTDENVVKLFAEAITPKLASWSGDPNDWSEEASEIAKSIQRGRDGYNIAKMLEEGFSVESDSELVSLMDEARFILDNILRKQIKEWVVDNYIICPFKIGDKVTFKVFSKTYTGEVIKDRSEEAQVVVFCEEKGHVKSGDGSYGSILNYEDVEAIKTS